MKTDPHVAICIPVMDKPHMIFSQSLAQMMYQCGRFGTPTALIHQGGSLITRARNQILEQVEKFEAEGSNIEWLFWLDSDMVFPQYTLHALMQHQRDIVGCTYVRRSPPFDVHGKTLEGKPRDVTNEKLVELSALPTGCLLVRREVFRSLKKPYFRTLFREETPEKPALEYGEDYVFCSMARTAGYRIWLDAHLSKEIGHIAEKPLFPEQDSWPEHREAMKAAANG